MEWLKRIEVRIPSDHPLFDLPPRIRGQRARELIQAGTEITQVKDEIVRLNTEVSQLKELILAMSLKLDQFALSPRPSIPPSPPGPSNKRETGQFDSGTFLKSFE